jgi:hypothetical protein
MFNVRLSCLFLSLTAQRAETASVCTDDGFGEAL